MRKLWFAGVLLAVTVTSAAPLGVIDAVKAGDWGRAKQRHYQLRVLSEMLFREPSPAPTKAALSLLGRCSTEVRLPLVAATAGLVDQLRNEILAAEKAAKDAAALLASSDPATIIQVLSEVSRGESSPVLQKVVGLASGVVGRILAERAKAPPSSPAEPASAEPASVTAEGATDGDPGSSSSGSTDTAGDSSGSQQAAERIDR